jgi:hypothetical protein
VQAALVTGETGEAEEKMGRRVVRTARGVARRMVLIIYVVCQSMYSFDREKLEGRVWIRSRE